MLIGDLCDYYDILAADKDAHISPFGYETVKVAYCAVLSEDGDLRGIDVLSVDKDSKTLMMPIRMKTTTISASPVCDNAGYIFGINGKPDKREVTEKKFLTAKKLHCTMFENCTGKEALAVKRFFENWDIVTAWDNPHILCACAGGALVGNIVFRLEGAEYFFHDVQEIVDVWLAKNHEKTKETGIYKGQCCITGKENVPIALGHTNFQGVYGAQETGAYLISYKPDSFRSYNLDGAHNSCVSEEASFKYSTALQYLLNNTRQNLLISNDTTVFWAQSAGKMETEVAMQIFSFDDEYPTEASLEKEDKQTIEIVRTVLKSGVNGIYNEPLINPEVQFSVLGLAPNGGRLAVRYYYRSTFKDFLEKVKLHYDDIRLFGAEKHREYVNLSNILDATIRTDDKNSNKKKKNSDDKNSHKKKINPLLGGAVMRAILTGSMYPQILLNQIIIRVKAEGSATHARCAVLKAFLSRQSRIKQKEEEIGMYLNEESKNPAYVLGRVFAILEIIQKKAQGDKLNATIKDRYFTSACVNPSSVFPNLLKTTQHHLAKLKTTYWEMQLVQCLSLIEGESFPKNLNTENQGRFILGYYQQRQKNYTKKQKEEE